MIRAVAFVCLIAFAAAPARADDPAKQMVYDLITQRLTQMKPVAAWKYANAVSVENLEREAVVLENAAADAAEAGMDPETVRPFFQAQIEAAKVIQHCWIQRWEDGAATPPADPPDLKAEIRPRLLSLGTALLRSIRNALAEGVDFHPDHSAKFAEAVDLDCLTPEARDAIHAGLGGIKLAR